MSELLRSGATMLFEHCPECNSPLFQVGDKIWCSNCNRRVVIVGDDEEAPATAEPALLDVERVILGEVMECTHRIKDAKDLDAQRQLGHLLITWLDVLERLKRLRAGR
jgi:UPF0148 protein